MSEIRDRRRRNDLDLFVLALLDSGVSTPYDLQQVAGLSPGATIPALRRLVAQKLVVAGEAGARGRLDYKANAEGRRYLRSMWHELIEAGPTGDLDADLRTALLAFSVGGNRPLAVDFLRQSATRKLDSAKSFERRTEVGASPVLAGWYRKLRVTAAESLIQAEAAAALQLARMLPRVPAGRQPRKRKEPRS